MAIQSTFLIPISSDTESREPTATNPFLFLEFDRYLWINEIFYDIPLSSSTQLFIRGSIWTSFPRDSYKSLPRLAWGQSTNLFLGYWRVNYFTPTSGWVAPEKEPDKPSISDFGLFTNPLTLKTVILRYLFLIHISLTGGYKNVAHSRAVYLSTPCFMPIVSGSVFYSV